jgi:putative Ca2+/H+ antiporter (TMEM165/GDT1 family)
LATDIKILVVYVVDIGDKAFPVTLIQATNWSPVFCNLLGFTFTWNHKNVDL